MRRIPAVTFSLIVAFLLVKGIVKQPEITNNKEKIQNLNQKIAEQQQRNDEVKDMMDKVDTDEYIEKVAREKLDLVKENEIIFIDVASE